MADIKTALGIADSDSDAAIETILRGVSTRIARACGRVLAGQSCLERAERTEYFSQPCLSSDIQLAAWPVDSVATVHESATGLYGAGSGASLLAAGTEYILDNAVGILSRFGTWQCGPRGVCVKYTGGFAPCPPWAAATYAPGDLVAWSGAVYTATLPDPVEGEEPATEIVSALPPSADSAQWTLLAGATPMPDDLVQAAIMQTCFDFNQKKHLGITNAGVQGGSVGFAEGNELLPAVKYICQNNARNM